MQTPMHNNTAAQPTELIALPEVMKITGFKTTKIYDMVNKGAFPKKGPPRQPLGSVGQSRGAAVGQRTDGGSRNAAADRRVNYG
ncbi:AlpA family phage regulatory protein [Pseudomonas sp. MS-1(2024)]|uniref:helix-turn-helix transcriptional regulator n=1 Tax=Pseudomonas sp. MS-1(2024) TaxID=3112251 RepID=UPI002DBE6CE9|nr:AlpA family phage regulatory protein [Pseudomonas sp. MS-1(2024)]MEC4167316.1 AlpA family phage regulatory protein [Pseudomonas sp. MS-1(2024)]